MEIIGWFCICFVNILNNIWLYHIFLIFRLARKGKTVIFSIHQPRYSIFKLFDNLILLSQGECVYHGQSSQALDYFQTLGALWTPYTAFIIEYTSLFTRAVIMNTGSIWGMVINRSLDGEWERGWGWDSKTFEIHI